jgi:hypothetical protein
VSVGLIVQQPVRMDLGAIGRRPHLHLNLLV